MSIAVELLSESLLVVARDAAVVANICDHVEHNEFVDMADVRMTGHSLRGSALALADAAGEDLVDLYRDRLRQIERRNVLYEAGGFDGAAALPARPTWRQLQLAQVEHDRVYHPDVLGLAKFDQLRHYALHVAKLAGATAGAITGDVAHADFVHRRVPDMLIFGVKLSTVVGERLPDETIASARADALGSSTGAA